MAENTEFMLINEPLTDEELTIFKNLGEARIANDATLSAAMLHHSSTVAELTRQTSEAFKKPLEQRGIDMNLAQQENYQFMLRQAEDGKTYIIRFKPVEKPNVAGGLPS